MRHNSTDSTEEELSPQQNALITALLEGKSLAAAAVGGWTRASPRRNCRAFLCQSNFSSRQLPLSLSASWMARGGPEGGTVTSAHSSCPGFRGNGDFAFSGTK